MSSFMFMRRPRRRSFADASMFSMPMSLPAPDPEPREVLMGVSAQEPSRELDCERRLQAIRQLLRAVFDPGLGPLPFGSAA